MSNPHSYTGGKLRDLIEEVQLLRREAHGFNPANPFKREMVRNSWWLCKVFLLADFWFSSISLQFLCLILFWFFQVVGTKCDMLHREALFNLDSLHFRLKARFPDIPVRSIPVWIVMDYCSVWYYFRKKRKIHHIKIRFIHVHNNHAQHNLPSCRYPTRQVTVPVAETLSITELTCWHFSSFLATVFFISVLRSFHQLVGISARFGLGLDRLVRTIRELVYPDMVVQTSRVQSQPLKDILLPTDSDIKNVSSHSALL